MGLQNQTDGTYRARLVALGFSLVPGVDFSNNFAPVVNGVTFRNSIGKNDDGRPKMYANGC